jgi:Tol biopolymer transport system component
MRDNKGAVQFWTVSPRGGDPVQVTHGPWEPRSAFTWHPDGSAVTFIADGSVVWVDVDSGRYRRLTEKAPSEDSPTRHACVFSPDGAAIAFMRPKGFGRAGRFDQIHLVSGWAD